MNNFCCRKCNIESLKNMPIENDTGRLRLQQLVEEEKYKALFCPVCNKLDCPRIEDHSLSCAV